MDILKKRWIVFLGIMFDPWNLILIGSLSILFSQTPPEENAVASALIYALVTAASAILGGRVTKQWVDITEGGVVVARGKSAVRSLKLLLCSVASLENRVCVFMRKPEEVEKHPAVTVRNYEEIVERCRLLEEGTVNSIENWADIVPEADIKTEVGMISELRNKLDGAQNDLQQQIEQLQQAKGQSEHEKQEKNRLKEEIKKKEKQVNDLACALAQKKADAGLTNLFQIESIKPFSLQVPSFTGILNPTDVSHGANTALFVSPPAVKKDDNKKS